jgi:ribose 5-phosphate isomerase B
MFDFNLEIPIGCDHAGFCLKTDILDTLMKEGYRFRDFGCFSEESLDYPDFVHPLAKAISDGTYSRGILICGSANGVSIVANKYPGVRSAICWNSEIASLARLHNDANIIALPARFIRPEEAFTMIRIFFTSGFEGGRHQRRVDKIAIPVK